MNQQPVYRFDDFEVDPEAWRLSRGGREIHLEPVVLKLLIYLIANRGRLVPRQELMDTVWGDTVISESALTKAVARLRKALGDDSATHRYLETVRSHGYRFIAPVEDAEHPDGPDARCRRSRSRTISLSLLAGGAAIVTLIVVAVFWFRAPPHEAPQEVVIGSLAVLPLNNLTGDPEKDYYVDGLHDLLITALYKLPGLEITSRQSTLRYRNSQLLTADIARELGVDAVVEGSLLREGSEIELTIQLIDGRSDKHLWAERYTRETTHVLELISDMADAIGVATVSPGIDVLIQDGLDPVDPRAIDAYALGTMYLDSFTRDGIRSAIDQFETAVAIEPEFALAWAHLGAAHAMGGFFGYFPPRESKEKLRAASLRAIAADDQASIGHSGLGWARWWTGNFDGGCESFGKALLLNPSAPYAIHGIADCLMFEGRMDESLAHLRKLLVISPFSAMHSMPLPGHLLVAGHFDEAITTATAMQARVPQFSMHWFFAKVYWQQGLLEKALEEERLELEWRGDTVLLAALEEGLAAVGPNGAMHAMAKALAVRASESYVDPYDIGETFARAGEIDEALHWLDKAVEHGSYEINYIAFLPQLDILHDDPRFQALLERVYGRKTEDIMQLGNLKLRQD